MERGGSRPNTRSSSVCLLQVDKQSLGLLQKDSTQVWYKEYMIRYFLGDDSLIWLGAVRYGGRGLRDFGDCEPFTPKELETIKDIKPLGDFKKR